MSAPAEPLHALAPLLPPELRCIIDRFYFHPHPISKLIKQLRFERYATDRGEELDLDFVENDGFFQSIVVRNATDWRKSKVYPWYSYNPVSIYSMTFRFWKCFELAQYRVTADARGHYRDEWVLNQFEDHDGEAFWERYWDEWLLKQYQALW